MKQVRKLIGTLILSILVVCTLIPLEAHAASFEVYVPNKLILTMDKTGTHLTGDQHIINASDGAVAIKGLKVTVKDGWSIVDNVSGLFDDTKSVSISINGTKVPSNGNINDINWRIGGGDRV